MIVTDLQTLLLDLTRAKPAGWSVVRRENQIQIRPRPADRALCKFIVRRNVTTTETLTVGCYNRRLNDWNRWVECPPEPVQIFELLGKYVDGLK
jgi:hypothetical protein